MPKAIWNDTVLAESDRTLLVEGNHYFPPDAVHWEHFQESDHHTVCSWKGVASYYHIRVGEAVNPNAAWTYPEPKEAAQEITDYVAFWRGVQIVDDAPGVSRREGGDPSLPDRQPGAQGR